MQQVIVRIRSTIETLDKHRESFILCAIAIGFILFGVHARYPDYFKGKFGSSKPKAFTAKSVPKVTDPATSTPVTTNSNMPSTEQAQQSGHTTSGSVPDYCSQTTIPFNTVTKYDNLLSKGQQFTTSGYNGTEYYCVYNGVKRVTGTVPALDATTTIGTYEPYTYQPPTNTTTPTPPPAPAYSYAEAYSLAQQNCSVQLGNAGAGNSSAYQLCINAYLDKYGY